MLKRDRTSEEKQFDVLLKRSIMRLGGEAAAAETPNAFTHYLAWDSKGRKGQRLKILKLNRRLGHLCAVEFEDGFEMIVNRAAIRRLKEDSCLPSSSSSSLPSS